MIDIPDYIGMLDSGCELILPEEAVTQGFAILARRRSGKSVLAGVMQEAFCRRGDPWVCLDPVSAHWGIKYRDAQGKPGKSSGLDVLVVGGKYGDVPLDEHMGAALAEIVCETNISCIVDLKMASMAARKRFVTEFANRLFAVNETPRHVFLEEAQEFCPQTPRWEEQKLVLGALERLIKGGGGQGIGFTLISQRPAAVSKEVLTQIDNLFVLRMSGPRDLDAVKEWFEHNVGARDQMRQILASLLAFQPGEAWLLSPEWLGELGRLRVRSRVTYHAGRTPKRGEGPVQPARIDVSAVIGLFEKAAEQRHFVVEQEVDLKKENARLQRELKKRPAPVTAPDPTLARRLAAAELRLTAAEQREGQLVGELGKAQDVLQLVADTMAALPSLLMLREAADRAAAARREMKVPPPADPRSSPPIGHPWPVAPTVTEPLVSPDGHLPGPQQRILNALATFEGVGLSSVQRSVVAAYAGASPRSSAFTNNLGRLRVEGLVDYPHGGIVALTDAGRQQAGPAEELGSVSELQGRWLALLPRPQAAIVERLIGTWPDDASRDEIALAVGASPTSSAYTNNLGRLRSLGLIAYPGTGRVRATELLWPEGLPA